MPDMNALREWVQQDDVKKQASAAEKKAKGRCGELEEEIIASMVEDGVTSIKVTLEAVDVDAQARAAAIEWAEAGFNLADDAGDFIQTLRDRGLLAESRPEITKTVFIGSRVWATPVPTGSHENGEPKATDADYERACRALEAEGWGEYVQERFNIISLSSAVNDEVKAGNIVIPEGETETFAFNGTIRVTEKPQLNSRRASAR